MNKKLRILALSILLAIVPATLSSCQNSGDNSSQNYVSGDYFTMEVEYEYKIVKCGSVVSVPELNINRDDYKKITYLFNSRVVEGTNITIPNNPGTYMLKIYVLDVMYKSHIVEVTYRATNNNQDLNIIYDLSTKEGVSNHLGKSRIGVNGQRITLYENGSRTYVNPYGDVVTDYPADINGSTIPSFYNEDTEQTVENFIVAENQTAITRLVYSNALNVKWDQKFSQVYFYFFNGAGTELKLNFNGYTVSILANSGWNKVIIAPKTVGSEIVTDYDVISSNGDNTTQTGMIDLEDCVGTFLKVEFTNNIFYGKYAMSSIWGKPKEA